MKSHMRSFTSDDYPMVNDINNAAYPEYPGTADEMRFRDEHRDPKCKFQRWVAECDGRVVGSAEYGQMPDMYHPRKFFVSVTVHPDHQRRGIGSALYDEVVESLREFDPLVLRAWGVREDMPHSIQFITNRGFREEMRFWESRLNVTTFDFTPYEGLEEDVRARDIEIKTLRELESDPQRDRKLYELISELDQDVPSPETPTKVSYEHFIEHTLQNPNLLPDAYFVAVHDGEYVGTSNLWKSQGNDDIYTGLTGVKRAYRRKGIALAMKLRGIAHVKSLGRTLIKTWNESNNRPMLSINEMLGYVKQPAWISFVKVLKEEE
jgi:GNAT superfamily N-acetyltransferase